MGPVVAHYARVAAHDTRAVMSRKNASKVQTEKALASRERLYQYNASWVEYEYLRRGPSPVLRHNSTVFPRQVPVGAW
jgi:hypothetical protein